MNPWSYASTVPYASSLYLLLWFVFLSMQQTGTTGINVILGRVCLNTVAVEIYKFYLFWVCVCGLIYPACRAHAPYCVAIYGVSGFTIYFHIISKTVRFSEKVIERTMSLWFSLQLLSEIFLILRRNRTDVIINVPRSSCCVQFSCWVSNSTCGIEEPPHLLTYLLHGAESFLRS